MACENLVIPKPLTNQCPSTLYGIPYQAAGRTVAGQTFPIAGIVLHCYDGTIGELCNEMKCRTRSSVISGSWENSYHYGIGAASSSGGFLQFVEDMNISWTFGTYKNNTYGTVPPPNIAINWPTLQGEYGINTTPDVYTIDIALAIGHIVDAAQPGGCYDCPTASGLSKTQHDMLVQMLAYLAQEYQLPIDSEHITFHDLIHCGEGMECPCTDIETLLAEVAAFCPPCEQESWVAPIAESNDQIDYIYGVTEPCCPNSPGCLNLIPWNACFIGDLAIDGTLDSYILGLSQDPVTGQWCMTRGCLATLPPLIGCGTVDDPLALNICAFGEWVPEHDSADMVNIIGLDINGCLIQAPWCEMVADCETPLTVIDTSCINLTAGGVNGHELQANIVISPDVGNQIQCLANGLFVDEADCNTILDIFQDGINIVTLYGDDGGGACGNEGARAFWDRLFCDIEQDPQGIPVWIAAQTTTECPKFVTPQSIIANGLGVNDTNTVNLTLLNNILSADVIIDPLADNILVANPAGLYVPPFVMTITGSNCILVNRVGNDFTISTILAGSIGGVTNVQQCTPSGLYVPRGADALVNGPLTGNGSDTNPLDINFSQLNGQDLCDLGNVIPNGTLVDLVGVDNGGCLRIQNPATVIANNFQVADTNCINLTFIGNSLTADPILSGPIGGVPNLLTCEIGGLYVPRGAGLNFLDTTCIVLSETNGVITATPVIDPDVANQLECRATGLFASTNLIAIDSACINLEYDQNSGQLQAFPILAAPQGGVPNVLSCLTGQGLYVPEGAGLQVQDTTCIDLTLQGAVLVADFIVDPTGDNQLTCLPAGAYVPPLAGLQIDNTPCIALSLDQTTLTATPILAPAQGGVANALQCLADGLYVSGIQLSDLLGVDDTNCIALTLDGNGVLTADPVISADICNGIECRADGLYVNNDVEGVSAAAFQGNFIQDFTVANIPVAETEFGNNVTLTFTNPSDCNDMAVFRHVTSSTVTFIPNACQTQPAVITAAYQWSNNGGATWNNTEQVTAIVLPGTPLATTLQGFTAAFTQGPGASNDLEVRHVISNIDQNFCGVVNFGDKQIGGSGTPIIA